MTAVVIAAAAIMAALGYGAFFLIVLFSRFVHFQMQRHMRKLDAELNKFKWELEADNPGITEVLEQSTYA